jgi:hypothetical protein
MIISYIENGRLKRNKQERRKEKNVRRKEGRKKDLGITKGRKADTKGGMKE